MVDETMVKTFVTLFIFLGCLQGKNAHIFTCDGSKKNCTEAIRNAFLGSTVNCTDVECSVEIAEGQHNISHSVIFRNIDISLVGTGSGAEISCSYSCPTDGFSLLFSRNQRLLLRNLHFTDCPGPIQAEEVKHVEIHNCSFRYFTEAVFDIFNCIKVDISNCTFEHNRGSGLLFSSNRGNTGCLAIGYNDLNSSINSVSVDVRNSKFVGNLATATVDDPCLKDTSLINLLGTNVYRGRGGAIGLFLHNVNATALISDCLFQNNSALYGAGMYIAYGGRPGEVQHTTTVKRCNFVENRAEFGGGAMLAAFRIFGDNANPMVAEVIDSNFTRNVALEVGGGVGFTVADSMTDQGVKGRLERCVFTGNRAGGFGSAARFTVINTFLERTVMNDHEVIDCIFRDNEGPHGTLAVAYIPLTLSGSISFENNTGQSLRVIGSVVTVDGDMRFIGNDARRVRGGAMYISSFGQILMRVNSSILFENNTGSTGAAIVVDTQRISSTYSKLLFNPQCFLLFENDTASPDNWINVSILFKGNSAEVGADVFTSSLETCSWYSYETPFFDIGEFQNWTIFQNSALSVQTDPIRVTIDPETVNFTAGHPANLSAVLLDQFGKETVGTLKLVDSSNHSLGIQIEPSVLVISPRTPVNVTFSLTSMNELSEDSLSIDRTIGVEDLLRSGLAALNVSMSNCPPGQSLRRFSIGEFSQYECQCNNDNQNHIILCDDDRNFVILQLGYWSVYAGTTLHGYSCPPGYCRCNSAASFSNRECYPTYSISEPEMQCVCGRQGILCGRCSESTGMTVLYRHCEDCHPAIGTVFIAAVILEASIVAVIIFFNIKLPSWMIPLLFYIRMASYYGYYFPPTFEHVGRYLYFLNSLLSLFFPYDFCVPSATALGLFAAHLMPLFVAMVVWPIAWILNKKHKGVYHWNGSITLSFLLFSHVMHTALQILNCPMVYNTGNEVTPRWYHDGEEKCFQGVHAPLGLLALAVLLGFVVLCVVLVITMSGRVKARWMDKLRMVIVELYFEERWKWWILVEVARRFILILILVIFPRSTIAPLVALTLLLCAYGYCKPFKDMFTNFLEMFLLACLSLLLVLPGNQYLIENLFNVVGEVPPHECPRDELVGLTRLSLLLLPFYYCPVLVAVVAVVCYHLYSLIIKKKKSKLSKGKFRKSTTNPVQTDVTRSRTVTEYDLTVYNDDDDDTDL